jgi:hypothetical protein
LRILRVSTQSAPNEGRVRFDAMPV